MKENYNIYSINSKELLSRKKGYYIPTFGNEKHAEKI
jgi:hypothetical protein